MVVKIIVNCEMWILEIVNKLVNLSVYFADFKQYKIQRKNYYFIFIFHFSPIWLSLGLNLSGDHHLKRLDANALRGTKLFFVIIFNL